MQNKTGTGANRPDANKHYYVMVDGHPYDDSFDPHVGRMLYDKARQEEAPEHIVTLTNEKSEVIKTTHSG